MIAPRKPAVPSCANAKKKRQQRHLHLETLEARLLLASDLDAALSQGVLCHCPVCAGLANSDVPTGEVSEPAPSESEPVAAALAVPALSSREGAAATIYLDFDGHFEAAWDSWTNVTSPVYDRDGDLTSFSASELTAITDIWARVAEDYAPFNVNVTTVEPPSFADGVAVRVVIGGGWGDWYGTQAGGVAVIGGFTNAGSNVAYVFENDLGNGFVRWTAEAVSHEAGHTFGLLHQSTWMGSVLQAEYSTGSGDWAPVMGNGNFAQRTTWHNGTTNVSPTSLQDDLAVLAGALGYVSDDHGTGTGDASVLPIEGTSVNVAGLIGQNGDLDVFEFTTVGGDLSFSLAVARVGANLDSVLELWDANGQVLFTANDSATYASSLVANVQAGTYFVVVRASGGYGNLGAYTLTGTVVPGVAAEPEISVSVDGVEFASGGTLNFGTAQKGAPVTRTITVTNAGDAPLELNPMALNDWPPGFSLVHNLGDTSLEAGESTTFCLQLNADAAGTFAGLKLLLSNDSDEAQFEYHLEGTVVDPPPPPEPQEPDVQIVDNGNSGFGKSGKWQRMRVNQGVGRDVHVTAPAPKRARRPAVAHWSFHDLESGTYRVSVTWPKATRNASNAPFSVYDGTALETTVRVNQRSHPSSFWDEGTRWHDLGTFHVESGWLRVELANKANRLVVADAVRIERVFETSNGALPEMVSVLTSSESSLPSLALLSLASGNDHAHGSYGVGNSACDRADDYWQSLASAAQRKPALPVEHVLRQQEDILSELSLLGEANSLLDELAAHLASHPSNGLADL